MSSRGAVGWRVGEGLGLGERLYVRQNSLLVLYLLFD